MSKIDFVITWVDGNDKLWQKEMQKYKPNTGTDTRITRYRDWGNLQYWFRGVEKFAPWVNNIFFITWGHIPKWLNTKHPKLKIVKHNDFIPKKYLPTFSSRTIDLNLHRIPGISEQFVYFNDDMFLINHVKKTDFFKNGLPCESVSLNTFTYTSRDENGKIIINTEQMFMAPLYNTAVINHHFNKNEVIKKNIFKWFNFKYGVDLFRTILLMPWPRFTGFKSYHIPYSYRKSTYEKVWDKEYELLDKTCSHKFRQAGDLNHFIFTYWHIAEGKFVPRSVKVGKRFNLNSYNGEKDVNNKVYKAITKQQYKMICANDRVFNDDDFEKIKNKLNNSFNKILPNKSDFEIIT